MDIGKINLMRSIVAEHFSFSIDNMLVGKREHNGDYASINEAKHNVEQDKEAKV